MYRLSRLNGVRRLRDRFCRGPHRPVACRDRRWSRGSRLRVEPLEDRRLLSGVPAGEPGGELAAASCPVAWDTVIHDDHGDLFYIDLAEGAGGCSPKHLGTMRDSVSGYPVVLTDMAYNRSEDAYYGVTSTSDYYGTSCLYKVTIDKCTDPQNPTIAATNFVGYIWADACWPSPGCVPVHLNALEFSNDGTRLFAAGTYDDALLNDWTFGINRSSCAGSSVLATRHVPLSVGGQGFHSAGDVEFDTNGVMYVSTYDVVGPCQGALLTISNPLSQSPAISGGGYTGYTDFFGLTFDPVNRLLGYLSQSHEQPPQGHRREIRRIDLNWISSSGCPVLGGRYNTYHFAWMYHLELDNLYGAATTLSAYPPARSTPGLYHRAGGAFHLKNTNSNPPSGADLLFRFGPKPSSWTAIAGDWNRDGVETVGLYDPSQGAFHLNNTNDRPQGGDVISFRFGPKGNRGWIPLAGDWDGDGDDTLGLYDPVAGVFHLKNVNANPPSGPRIVFPFGPKGNRGWQPLAGDWDGDGDDTLGLYDPAGGALHLKNVNANPPGGADIVFRFGPRSAGWQAIAGDWNDDGVDTVGLYDPAHAAWHLKNVNANPPGGADIMFRFGPRNTGGWQALAGDWDGLGSPAKSAAGSPLPGAGTPTDRPTIAEALFAWDCAADRASDKPPTRREPGLAEIDAFFTLP